MSACPRCSRPVTTAFSRHGTYPHRCPHGLPCRKDGPGCDACRAARTFARRLYQPPILRELSAQEVFERGIAALFADLRPPS